MIWCVQTSCAGVRVRRSGRQIVAADFVNHEAEDDPDDDERGQIGPAGFLATAAWLRAAFEDLHFEPAETAVDGGTVLAACTMTGRHTGAFQGIEPTGRRFAQSQVHIFTTRGGQITSHRAVRDDLGLLLQLGWRPRG
ncbi:putative ester cyclase [Mycobacterium sp. MAA66]|uniref:ester cyclase n=1 Tax=Mycobacterium sp. MAA66 TaxID=3156297 RepID=UPI0035132B2C